MTKANVYVSLIPDGESHPSDVGITIHIKEKDHCVALDILNEIKRIGFIEVDDYHASGVIESLFARNAK